MSLMHATYDSPSTVPVKVRNRLNLVQTWHIPSSMNDEQIERYVHQLAGEVIEIGRTS
ncbi:MAG TPA: hypothetical protein VJQ57_09530 [Acidimicrobiia bacterium]|nr:hypothetical protein [Acidimicrobiia bacterium]